MTPQGIRFRLGVFVLAAGILLAWLVILFARMPAFLTPKDEYYIVFDYAPGVAPGTPVRRSGVRIGSVHAVDLDNATGKVRVTIRVERPHVLFEDDEPVLVKGLLGGDVSVDFQQRGKPLPTDLNPAPAPPKPPEVVPPPVVPASFQAPPPVPPPVVPERLPAKPGKVFQGTSQSDIAGMFRRFDQITPVVEETLQAVRDLAKTTRDVVPQIQRTSDEVRVMTMNWGRLGERLDVLVQANQDKAVKALDSLTEALGQASKMFSEENQRNLNATLRNVREGTDNLGSLSKNTDELVKRVQKSVEQADQVLANLNQATKPFAERGDKITKNLEESTERLNAVLTDVRELLRGVGRGDGTFQRFISDPALYQNLNDAAFMLTRLLPRMERILKDVEVFADKIARHPESLGVRGAVSPSSGLKESLGAPLIPRQQP